MRTIQEIHQSTPSDMCLLGLKNKRPEWNEGYCIFRGAIVSTRRAIADRKGLLRTAKGYCGPQRAIADRKGLT